MEIEVRLMMIWMKDWSTSVISFCRETVCD